MKFRKRPVVIEAEQFNPAIAPLPFRDQAICCFGPTGWYVETLEGPLHISEGDWIIRGVKGEFYPCKPDVFAATYEEVNTPEIARHQCREVPACPTRRLWITSTAERSRSEMSAHLDEHLKTCGLAAPCHRTEPRMVYLGTSFIWAQQEWHRLDKAEWETVLIPVYAGEQNGRPFYLVTP